jgi:hypothetical protein
VLHLGFVGLLDDADDHLEEEDLDVRGEDVWGN